MKPELRESGKPLNRNLDEDDRSRITYSKTNKIYPNSMKHVDWPEERQNERRPRSQRQIEEDPYLPYDPKVHRFDATDYGPEDGQRDQLPTHSNISKTTRKKEASSTIKKYVPNEHTHYI